MGLYQFIHMSWLASSVLSNDMKKVLDYTAPAIHPGLCSQYILKKIKLLGFTSFQRHHYIPAFHPGHPQAVVAPLPLR